MTGTRQTTGRFGERLAAKHLQRFGYEILERNYRCPLGEIDLIAREGNDLVFIEVKTRRSSRFGQPVESVTLAKQQKIARIAEYYLAGSTYRGPCRFDVVGIVITPDNTCDIQLIRDAFSVS